MDIEADNTLFTFGPQVFDFAMPFLQTPYAPLKEASNSALTDNINMSLEPSLPMIIPYSANVLADPSFWNSNFIATLLFSTNKFLQSDICNMTCLLQHMACFLK